MSYDMHAIFRCTNLHTSEEESVEDPEVICLGETMAMVTPARAVPLKDSDVFQMFAGGAESTVAMYLAERRHRVAWVSALGDDPFAIRILRELADRAVDLSYVTVMAAAQTGVYFKDPGNQATAVHYYRRGSAASRMGPDILDDLPLASARLVHTTGITAALSPSCGELVLALCERLRDSSTTLSFDVNYRPTLWLGQDAAASLLNIARQADLVFVGRDEAEALWGTTDARSIRDFINPAGRLVVKEAALGATEFSGNDEVFVPSVPVDEIIEVVGAGDAFAAGYLAALLRGACGAQALQAGHELAGRALRSMSDFVPFAETSP